MIISVKPEIFVSAAYCELSIPFITEKQSFSHEPSRQVNNGRTSAMETRLNKSLIALETRLDWITNSKPSTLPEKQSYFSPRL